MMELSLAHQAPEQERRCGRARAIYLVAEIESTLISLLIVSPVTATITGDFLPVD
jgi:hypothetical protein